MTETLQSMEDNLIDAIVILGNNPVLMKNIEPQVMQPLRLERWMVVRTLIVESLLLEALENDGIH